MPVRASVNPRSYSEVEGLIAATAVGALAGLLPAIIAVHAEVIDAIRF
jgi:putative ABC transport system permease protein